MRMTVALAAVFILASCSQGNHPDQNELAQSKVNYTEEAKPADTPAYKDGTSREPEHNLLQDTRKELSDSSGASQKPSPESQIPLEENQAPPADTPVLPEGDEGILVDSSFTGEIWAPGVSLASGYFDVNKKNLYWNDAKSGETNTCWQATSSNMIAWWQLQRKVSNPVDAAVLYDKFRSVWGNAVGTYENGVGWYIAGTSNAGNDFGGYLSAYIRPYEWRIFPVGSATGYKSLSNFTDFAKFSQFLVENMGKSAMGMKLVKHKSGDGAGHAVTLWGIHVTGGIVDMVYISDSDDNYSGIKKYAVDDAAGYVRISGYDSGYYDKIYGLMALFQ